MTKSQKLKHSSQDHKSTTEKGQISKLGLKVLNFIRFLLSPVAQASTNISKSLLALVTHFLQIWHPL